MNPMDATRRAVSLLISGILLAGASVIGLAAAPAAQAGAPAAHIFVQTQTCPAEIQTPAALTSVGGALEACDNTVLPGDEPVPPDGYVYTNSAVAQFDYVLTPSSGTTRRLAQAELSGGGFCVPETMTCRTAHSYAWFDVPPGPTNVRLVGPTGYRPGVVTVVDGAFQDVAIPATINLTQGTIAFNASPAQALITVAYFLGFADTVGSPFNADINWIAAEGITGGCGGFRYCPKNPVTREQMASFLVRGLDLAPSSVDAFTDDDSSIHEAAINALAASGITGGCATDRFCPKATVTREQMASFLVRGLELAPSGVDAFTDDDTSIHEAAINAVAASGITGGCATDRFCPKATVTREQMAAFLRRGLEDSEQAARRRWP